METLCLKLSQARMDKYLFAVNRMKAIQAEEAVRTTGAEVTEESVKEEYVKRGGLVREVPLEDTLAPVEKKSKKKK
jgi:hypothetical protein